MVWEKRLIIRAPAQEAGALYSLLKRRGYHPRIRFNSKKGYWVVSARVSYADWVFFKNMLKENGNRDIPLTLLAKAQ